MIDEKQLMARALEYLDRNWNTPPTIQEAMKWVLGQVVDEERKAGIRPCLVSDDKDWDPKFTHRTEKILACFPDEGDMFGKPWFEQEYQLDFGHLVARPSGGHQAAPLTPNAPPNAPAGYVPPEMIEQPLEGVSASGVHQIEHVMPPDPSHPNTNNILAAIKLQQKTFGG